MNIIKIQDQLKGVPDNTLVGYVQSPTGSVPTYLALSELQRRKEMRSKYQANMPEESSVAEDLLQESQPQPEMAGVAGLPEARPMMEAMQPPPQPEMPMEQMAQGGLTELDVGDMYDENSYASGGIVAFAGPEGSYVSSDPRPYYYGEDEEEVTSPFRRFADYLDISGNVKKSDFGRRREERKKIDEQIQKTIPTLIGGERGWFDQETKADQRAYKQKRKELEALRRESPFFAPEAGGYVPTELPAKSNAQIIAEQNEKALKDKENALKNMTKQNAGGAREKVKSLADYANEFRDVVGTDPMQAKLAERLEKMDSRAAKMEEQAPWMALAQAGFEMASARPEFGKGQSAFADIARGATAGVKSYSDARDKMVALEEKRFGLMADMAKAQRAEQLAIASKGADSRDAQLAREQQYKIHQEDQALKLKLNILDNSAVLQKAQIAAANKDLPNAVERATKIDPLVLDDKDYKAGLKALEGKYGDEGVIPGSPNYSKYEADVDALYRKIYAKKIRDPLAASSFGAGTLSYTPGKGFN